MSLTVKMEPSPGERQVAFVGDEVSFTLSISGAGAAELAGSTAFLRTTLGSGAILNDEIVRAFESSHPISKVAWHDIPMEATQDGFAVRLTLGETGFFRAKAYWVDAEGRQQWPAGDDFGISIHPSEYRTANTIYCAWARLFGEGKAEAQLMDPDEETRLAPLDERGYTVIPPSGTFRDLAKSLDHIMERLGCRILHLLPVNPTPTTMARFGRYGSPYASLDLTAIDPALVEFDQRATGVEQFCELTTAVHRRGGRVFLDLVINHTGWGSTLYEAHPEWFRRHADGRFQSPGAWGTVWEDLVELEHDDPAVGRHLAEVFLTWCRRGVDGFRCDAGYMVPLPIWRYITARVRREFPAAIFLLEGLGGAWETTEQLLTEGGMQWAYSELFQNYSGQQVAWYLDYALRQSQRMGNYVHYSETHDNPRLAGQGEAWSRLRNRLCGLTSVGGGFGFTCGVEWLAAEKIVVHQRTGLNWGASKNLVADIAQLNQLLCEHPCFFDGAQLQRLSGPDADVFVLERVSADGRYRVVVLVNTLTKNAATAEVPAEAVRKKGKWVDLLGQSLPAGVKHKDGRWELKLEPASVYCVTQDPLPADGMGADYRQHQAVRAWAVGRIQTVWPEGLWGNVDWDGLVSLVANDPIGFLATVRAGRRDAVGFEWNQVLKQGAFPEVFPSVVLWEPGDERRVVPVPADHWFLVRDRRPFVVRLHCGEEQPVRHFTSVALKDDCHVVAVDSLASAAGEVRVEFASLAGKAVRLEGRVKLLPFGPSEDGEQRVVWPENRDGLEAPIVLLTNSRGGMARLGVDFGAVKSKYDCLLGANLHERVPVDRYVLAKRARIWVRAGGLITGLGRDNLISFDPGPPARWRFLVCAGQAKWVPLELTAELVTDRNTLLLRCRRVPASEWDWEDVEQPYGQAQGERARLIPAEEIDAIEVSLAVRMDLEDRSFHWETERSEGAEAHFNRHLSTLKKAVGFRFQPAPDRRLEVRCDRGVYRAEPEWSVGLKHGVEASRGQKGHGDAFSPGWFDVPLTAGEGAHWQVCAEAKPLTWKAAERGFAQRERRVAKLVKRAGVASEDVFGVALAKAIDAYVVRRDDGWSVIAGYPWFLDWGRDSLICARGLLVAGYEAEVDQLLQVYGRLEAGGTLPNSIHGEDTSNRDTSDAPLWFGMVCRDRVERMGLKYLDTPLDESAPEKGTIGGVLVRIAEGYAAGTPNGIRMDADSGLVWSPSHFTWMDTNHPPGTPREGYPVEIQVMWIQLLRLLERAGDAKAPWKRMANLAEASFHKYFWVESTSYLADGILASSGVAAADGTIDRSIRSNAMLAVGTGLVRGSKAQRAVAVALRHLIVPGGVRSLAALPVEVPLPVHGGDGGLLNDPHHPYWGRYEGDEDTRRKPAYHNGTVWTWPLGTLLEAVLEAWEGAPEAVAAVRSYLSASEALLSRGCVGQLPEVMDGDAPHTQRGCDAQAWGVTEAFRIWKRVSGSVRESNARRKNK